MINITFWAPGRIFTKAVTSLTAKNSANGEPCHGLQKVLLLEGVYLVEPVADLIPRTLPWKWPNDIFCSKKSTKSRSWWNYLAPRMGWRGWTGGWTGCSWAKSSSLQIHDRVDFLKNLWFWRMYFRRSFSTLAVLINQLSKVTHLEQIQG